MPKYFIVDRCLFFVNSFEHELNAEQIIVNKLAKPCTYMNGKLLSIFYDHVWKNFLAVF